MKQPYTLIHEFHFSDARSRVYNFHPVDDPASVVTVLATGPLDALTKLFRCVGLLKDGQTSGLPITISGDDVTVLDRRYKLTRA